MSSTGDNLNIFDLFCSSLILIYFYKLQLAKIIHEVSEVLSDDSSHQQLRKELVLIMRMTFLEV